MKTLPLILIAILFATQLSAKSFTKWTQKDFWAPIPSGELIWTDEKGTAILGKLS